MSTAIVPSEPPTQPVTPGQPGSTPRRVARSNFDPTRMLLSVAAPLVAVLVAVAITSGILLLADKDVMGVWKALLDWPIPRKRVNIINDAMPLYISGVAVAIGFRMNLFNIGVEGQYRFAAFVAAWVAGAAWLSGWPNIILGLLAAMAAGAFWAGIAGWLKVTRGVNEVVSTIMLNSISIGLVAFLLNKANVDKSSYTPSTQPLKPSSQVAGLDLIDKGGMIYGLLPLVILVGVAYWFMLNRTRFGFDLRASGRSETAARASGISAKRMVIISMLLSGAVAGLVGMPVLFGRQYAFTMDTQAGLGFAGIAVALLGRNHPLGIAIGALLWSFLDQQKVNLSRLGVSNELVSILQGIIVLSVVIAYEVVRRLNTRLEQAKVARALGGDLDVPSADVVDSVEHREHHDQTTAPSATSAVATAPTGTSPPTDTVRHTTAIDEGEAR